MKLYASGNGAYGSTDAAGPVRAFFALQLADLFTTMVFRSMGIAETNPVASSLMEHFGTFPGLLILKFTAISIAIAAGATEHPRFLRSINVLYTAIVVLNVLTIVHARW